MASLSAVDRLLEAVQTEAGQAIHASTMHERIEHMNRCIVAMTSASEVLRIHLSEPNYYPKGETI